MNMTIAFIAGASSGLLFGWVAGCLTIFKAFGHLIDFGKRWLIDQASIGAPSGGGHGLGRLREASEPVRTAKAGA